MYLSILFYFEKVPIPLRVSFEQPPHSAQTMHKLFFLFFILYPPFYFLPYSLRYEEKRLSFIRERIREEDIGIEGNKEAYHHNRRSQEGGGDV